MGNHFYFKNNNYGKGTVVKVYEKHQEKFKFYSNLVFEECDNQNNLCYFRSLYNNWDSFSIPQNQLEEYVEDIIEPHNCMIRADALNKANPKYIEGITSGWIWYILIMIFGLFLKGPINMILTWTVASIIFFSWRYKKINGE